MKTSLNIFKKYFFVIFLGALIITSACKKDEDDEGNPPDLPPQSSFVFDMSAFPTEKKAAEIFDLTKVNFRYAFGQVFWWQTFITAGMFIPVASFVEAFNHEPVRQAPGWWIWSYSFDAASTTYTAALHGKIIATQVQWEMYISKEGSYEDFLWYTGESNLDGTEGFWILNKDPLNAVEMLQIDWHRNIADSTGDIRFTNIISGDANNGSYIFYGLIDDAIYNAFYDISLTSTDKMTEIEWNTETHEGHVMDSTIFHDEEWHCWDNLLDDINCN